MSQAGRIVPLVNRHCRTGENPYWHPGRRRVYWTDIPAGVLYSCRADGTDARLEYQGPPVGGFTLQADDRWLLFRVHDLALLSCDGSVRSGRPYQDAGMRRFNDVIADPAGRVFAGTIGQSAESAGLYRVDLDGSVHRLFLGCGVANGMGFSPDLKTFYWTCTTHHRIFRFDYDMDTGRLGPAELFHQARESDGRPDGLCVDQEGGVWSAFNGGGCVRRFAPDGRLTTRIDLPVPKPTSLCWGGDGWTQLFVTTGGGTGPAGNAQRQQDAPAAVVPAPAHPDVGTLYRLDVEVAGQAEFLSRIVLGAGPWADTPAPASSTASTS